MGIKLISNSNESHFYGTNSLLYDSLKQYFKIGEVVGEKKLEVIRNNVIQTLDDLINEHKNCISNRNSSRQKEISYNDTIVLLNLNEINDKLIYDWFYFLNFINKSSAIVMEEAIQPFD